MHLVTLNNSLGITVVLADYGARLIDVTLPNGQSIVCGYSNTDAYLTDSAYMGATVGPIANRIRDGKLSINGKPFSLELNHKGHSLHSGALSFAHRTWAVIDQTKTSVTFALDFEPAREDPKHTLPGKQRVLARYTLLDNQIVLTYTATTDQSTYLNLTNHCYWNLNAADLDEKRADIRSLKYRLYSEGFAEKDATDIPTGRIQTLATPIDFEFGDERLPAELREQVDHHFVVDKNSSSDNEGCHLMADIYSNDNRIVLQVSGTQPGFQFYSGQYLNSPFRPFDGFCIEPQFMPNAINIESAESPLTTVKAPYLEIIKFGLSWE